MQNLEFVIFEIASIIISKILFPENKYAEQK